MNKENEEPNNEIFDTPFKNLVAFLCLMYVEDHGSFLDLSPSYIKEKYLQYLGSPEEPNYESGIHPVLRLSLYDEYIKKWGHHERQ